MKKLNLIRSIKSNEFALTVAILSVLVQSFHSFTAFYNMSSLKGSAAGIIQAVLFAIVVDLAVLFYTVRNKKDVVLFASIFLFVINAYYYFSHWGFTWELIFAAFLSILVPVTQYYYSEEIRDEEETPVRPEIEHTIKSLTSALNDWKKQALDFREQLVAGEKKNHELAEVYYQAVEQRDKLRNSNSVLSEAVGRHLAENHELKKRLGDLPADASLDVEIEAKKIEEEIQDKSLLNVQGAAYEPTYSGKPVV